MCESMQGAATVEVGPAPSAAGRFKDCTSAAAWEGQQQDRVPQTKTSRVTFPRELRDQPSALPQIQFSPPPHSQV